MSFSISRNKTTKAICNKGFAINGFKSNHYPDFIIGTQSGKVIIVETKGDDRDNSDSEAKCRLGLNAVVTSTDT